MSPRLPPVLLRLARATKPVRRVVFGSLERLEPPARLLHRRTLSASAPYGVACVYRRANWRTVERLLRSAPPGTRTALWALDEVAPALAGLTVGTGPGTRIELLNRLTAHLELPPEAWLVLTDDDVVLRHGTLADLVGVAADLGWDVCQPAHSHRSTHFWKSNEHRFLTWARATRFVETGPLVLFSGRAREACLPLPEEFSMGIGIEAVWASQPDLRLGVIDSITMVHSGVVGSSYDADAEWRTTEPLVTDLLRPLGLATLDDLQEHEQRWWWLQRRPSWGTRDRPAGPTSSSGPEQQASRSSA